MTMNITLDRDPFLAAMQRVIGAVDRRATIAVIRHVIFTPTENGLRLMATNLDLQATAFCVATCDTDKAFTLPGQTVMDILNNLPSGAQIQIASDPKDPRLTFKSGRSRFKLPTLNAGDLPVMDKPDAPAIALKSADLARAIEGVAYAVSREATRYYICGVYIHPSDGGYAVVATDGHRLAMDKITAPDAVGSAIIPTAFVTEMARNLGDGEVELSIGSSRVMVSCDGFELIGKVVDGSFPDYQRVVPKDNSHTLTVDVEALKGAIKRAMIVSTDNSRTVRLVISAGAVSVAAKNADSGESETEIEAEWDGPDMAIGFSGPYLIEMLDRVTGETATFALKDKDTAALIVEGDRSAVVMPLRA